MVGLPVGRPARAVRCSVRPRCRRQQRHDPDDPRAAVAAQFAAYLAAHPAAVPAGAEIDVIECLNPDGLALNTRANARNVDLNRNFPTATWSSTLAPGNDPGGLGLSGGSRPASEPETQTLLAYLRRGFSLVLSLHSSGGILDYNGPGGAALAKRMSALCGLPLDHLAYQSTITVRWASTSPIAITSPSSRWSFATAV